MSDRIVVMNEGRVEQIGTPSEIYNCPRTRFVASFVGTLNILHARVIEAASGRVSIDGQEIVAHGVSGVAAGAGVSLALRPEAITIEDRRDPEDAVKNPRATEIAPAPASTLATRAREGRNRLSGRVEEVSFLGSVVRVRIGFGENRVSMDTFNNPGAALPARGDALTVSFACEDVLVLDDPEVR
jgi:putative spermidine/putrescine transport system ATP-binding protein